MGGVPDIMTRRGNSDSVASIKFFKKYGIIGTYCHAQAGVVVTKLLYKAGIHPNMVTVLGFLASSVGCFLLLSDDFPRLVSLFLLHSGLVLDYSDGQLARISGKTSKYGAWLDNSLDRAVEFFLIASVSITLLRDKLSILNAMVGFATLFVVMYQYYIYDVVVFRDSAFREEDLKLVRRTIKSKTRLGRIAILLRLFFTRDVLITILSISILINRTFEAMLFTIVVGIMNILTTFLRETITVIYLRGKY